MIKKILRWSLKNEIQNIVSTKSLMQKIQYTSDNSAIPLLIKMN